MRNNLWKNKLLSLCLSVCLSLTLTTPLIVFTYLEFIVLANIAHTADSNRKDILEKNIDLSSLT